MGIDPGELTSGVVQLDFDPHSHRLIKTVISYANCPNENLIKLLTDYKGEVAIEWIESFGMPVGQSIFETCFWVGRFAQVANVNRIARSDIKLHFCGTKKANDSTIRRVLLDRFGEPGIKKNPNPITYQIKSHAWQALAVAVFYMDKTAKNVERI